MQFFISLFVWLHPVFSLPHSPHKSIRVTHITNVTFCTPCLYIHVWTYKYIHIWGKECKKKFMCVPIKLSRLLFNCCVLTVQHPKTLLGKCPEPLPASTPVSWQMIHKASVSDYFPFKFFFLYQRLSDHPRWAEKRFLCFISRAETEFLKKNISKHLSVFYFNLFH